jgi:hypothetical protein
VNALFATTLPDVNDRTLACADRFSATWDEASHHMQALSGFRYRHEKAARYGEAEADAPAAIESIRLRLNEIRDELAVLAADAEKVKP